jgi:alpha-galactosidase/6-phospho-beta-glucosidase family protein
MQARLDLDQISTLLDEMLAASTRWLPQFSSAG